MRETVESPGGSRPQLSPFPGDCEPAWAVACLFPPQGQWTEEDYLGLPTKRLVELADGSVEVLPVPTRLHQAIVAFLHGALKAFVEDRRLGRVYFAPLPLHLWPGRYREPDVMYVRDGNVAALRGEYLEGADLVMEVVSSDDPDRDWVKKRLDYARAGISEYWIVDPQRRRIVVLLLEGDAYRVHGEHAPGGEASSALLPGFTVSVDRALRPE